MGKFAKTLPLVLLLAAALCVGAQAMENDMLKVGIKYGANAMETANLQNYSAFGGYALGYYDSAREFTELAALPEDCEKISVTTDSGYHAQSDAAFADFDEARALARELDGFVAYLDGDYVVRSGSFSSYGEADVYADGLSDGAYAVSPSATGVTVLDTDTGEILFAFDCSGLRSLGIEPLEAGEKTVTWFRGYRYYGGFEYQRVTGGNINVINVVGIEDYVKCVIPWEMSNDWPLEALKAQAVCARTYAAMQTRHASAGFDVCTTTDCQVYQGTAACNAYSDSAVDETAGEYLYCDGEIVTDAVYYSSNGGASEDSMNVWGSEVSYLQGKTDPYESYVAARIAKYNWSTTYSTDELTALLRDKGYDVGKVKNLYISAFTENGNVYSITFTGSGGSKTFYREACRTLLGLRSMRFTINGGAAESYYVNDGSQSVGLSGVYTISGDGAVDAYGAAPSETYVITSNGISALEKKAAPTVTDSFVITGSGNGHNVGMSQWGAYAMADLGYSYRNILQFYYTGVEIG